MIKTASLFIIWLIVNKEKSLTQLQLLGLFLSIKCFMCLHYQYSIHFFHRQLSTFFLLFSIKIN
ncbi:hypothetical protein BXA52_19120 [Enterococcus faecium]|nr:hypothetical protein BXA52_19120 [Enterococcus faecium]